MKPQSNHSFTRLISPFMMAGVLVVLLPIFGIMTLDRMEKHKAHIKEQLMVKGLALIRTFEAGTRIGMLTMSWGTKRIQAMLLETSFQPDVAYIMIVSKTGEILAHSDEKQVGQILDPMPDLAAMDADPGSAGQRIRERGKEKVFEVYKRFTPLMGDFRGRHKMFHDMLRQGGLKGPGPPPAPQPFPSGLHGPFRHGTNSPGKKAAQNRITDQYIFAGLSMARADVDQARLLKETLGRGVLFFIMGCAGMISLFAFQAYRSAKASLTSMKAFSDNVVQYMPSGLVTLDRDGRISSMNRAAKDILGTSLTYPFPEMEKMRQELEGAGKPVTREVSWAKAPEGGELMLDMTASFIKDNEENVLGCLFLFRDLTQLKKLKKEVETTRHLAAIGKLAGGVAHEIRNPLSSIKGFATYFEKRYRDNPDDCRTARIMVQEVERINRSITQLLEFAKPLAVEIRQVDLKTLVSHSLKLVEHDLEKKSIRVEKRIQTQISPIRTDPDRMNQVLLNLYINAVAAMEKGGTLRVIVRDTPDRDAVLILVEDDGCGIDPAHLSAVFDPYFTTRPDGTGLGLSIVHRIVENLGGHIRVESRKGTDTCFCIELPVNFKQKEEKHAHAG